MHIQISGFIAASVWQATSGSPVRTRHFQIMGGIRVNRDGNGPL